ncbi:MAG: FKBP-type peptidyl-prolyl cis-trans isomerase [Acidobacteria bacterium]|nr:FKBP-type peptidyl-prolyl cis-trans isomerase [Acidobacteriota bacterium]
MMATPALLVAALLLSQPSADLTTTATGLRYTDLKVGTGATPAQGQRCVVHYTGWLWERGRKGLVFDTSQGGDPLEFRIGKGQVIPGWDEGIGTMKVGGRRRLLVPAALAYGSAGTPDGAIPPNATLCFEVELVGLR